MTYLYKERQLIDNNFDLDSFIGARIESGKFYKKFNQVLREKLSKKTLSDFDSLMNVAYEYSCLLISERNPSQAFDCYFNIYCKLEHTNYSKEDRDFINSLNKVELYYNLGIISKEFLNDFDRAMYYFGKAGDEYSRVNNVTTEAFFNNEMIDAPGRAFSGFSSLIHQNCFGYSTFAPAFHYKSVFGYETDKTTVQKLLKDFKYPLFLQFVFTVSSYFKWLPLRHNIIKGVKITRILGEMSWLFECYLKQKLNSEKTLKLLMDDFVDSKLLKEHYKNLLTKEFLDNAKKDSILVLKNLIEMQEIATNVLEKQTICLLITYVMRNYSSHNFNDTFFAFDGDKYTKKIMFSCLFSFFIVLNNLNTSNTHS